MYQPLADLLRPQTLDEVYGQEHILGKGAVLRRLIDSGNIPNMVFYGPSGTGKTTVANIIAKQTNQLCDLSLTADGLKQSGGGCLTDCHIIQHNGCYKMRIVGGIQPLSSVG